MTISETYNENCMALMARYPDKHFDLAVVDPPYGINMDIRRMNGSRVEKKIKSILHFWDNSIPNKDYFSELIRVSKKQIIWGGNYMTDYLPPSKCWIFWDKKTGENSYGDGELAWTSFDGVIKKFTLFWSGAHAKEKNEYDRIHPTQKPVALYSWIFANYAKPGQLILDTHLGSGSSRIAADKAGLNFVGCELDADYFAAQEKRWREYKMQLKLL